MSSFYVRPTGKSSWRVLETYYDEGKRKSRQVKREAYEALGINPNWDVETATVRIKQINKINTHKRQISGAARRLSIERSVSSSFIPQDYAAEFVTRIKANASTPTNEKKALYHWNFVQELIKDVRLEPQDYFDNAIAIYKYFQTKRISPSYADKITIMLNKWGRFVARKQAIFFEPLPYASGPSRQRIQSAYRTSKLYRGGGSEALTPEILASIWDGLPSPEQANFLFVTVWFGLRPEEAEALISKRHSYRIDGDTLWIYQSKLIGLDEPLRWKPIKIRFKEQRQALEMIKAGSLEKPRNKVLKNLTGRRITLYGGRKGFVDLMLRRSIPLETIAVEMGHRSIQRTWTSYKDKQRTG